MVGRLANVVAGDEDRQRRAAVGPSLPAACSRSGHGLATDLQLELETARPRAEAEGARTPPASSARSGPVSAKRLAALEPPRVLLERGPALRGPAKPKLCTAQQPSDSHWRREPHRSWGKRPALTIECRTARARGKMVRLAAFASLFASRSDHLTADDVAGRRRDPDDQRREHIRLDAMHGKPTDDGVDDDQCDDRRSEG
jgi:hypothetical protein